MMSQLKRRAELEVVSPEIPRTTDNGNRLSPSPDRLQEFLQRRESFEGRSPFRPWRAEAEFLQETASSVSDSFESLSQFRDSPLPSFGAAFGHGFAGPPAMGPWSEVPPLVPWYSEHRGAPTFIPPAMQPLTLPPSTLTITLPSLWLSPLLPPMPLPIYAPGSDWPSPGFMQQLPFPLLQGPQVVPPPLHLTQGHWHTPQDDGPPVFMMPQVDGGFAEVPRREVPRVPREEPILLEERPGREPPRAAAPGMHPNLMGMPYPGMQNDPVPQFFLGDRELEGEEVQGRAEDERYRDPSNIDSDFDLRLDEARSGNFDAQSDFWVDLYSSMTCCSAKMFVDPEEGEIRCHGCTPNNRRFGTIQIHTLSKIHRRPHFDCVVCRQDILAKKTPTPCRDCRILYVHKKNELNGGRLLDVLSLEF